MRELEQRSQGVHVHTSLVMVQFVVKIPVVGVPHRTAEECKNIPQSPTFMLYLSLTLILINHF